MKRLSALLMALSLLLLCSCSGNSYGNFTSGDNSFSLTAESYSDTNSTTISVSESAEATVSISVSMTGGDIDCYCLSSSGEQVFQSDFSSGGNYSFKLTGPDEYTLYVTGKRFTGYIGFTWDILGAVSTAEASPAVVVIDPNAFNK